MSDAITRYMEMLPGAFQANKAGDIDLVIQFNFSDPSIAPWHLEIRNNKCATHEGTVENATISVQVDPKIFIDIQKGKIMANMAVSRGKMRLSGDLTLAFRIGSFFKLPQGFKFQLL